jgi:large subunit ribosomal protein L16
MLLPRKVKHRKWQKNPAKGMSGRGTSLAFGSFGLKAMTPSWVTSRQIESVRKVLVRFTRKGGKIWIRIFPDKPITTGSGSNQTTMGGGKGNTDHYVFNVQPGRILFEIDGISREDAMRALHLASHKLPIKAKIVERNHN